MPYFYKIFQPKVYVCLTETLISKRSVSTTVLCSSVVSNVISHSPTEKHFDFLGEAIREWVIND